MISHFAFCISIFVSSPKERGSQEIIIVMGNLNAKVGSKQDPLKARVGRNGLGERNDHGDLWVNWCTTYEQVIMNT